MAIIAKADADITPDDLAFLRENYTSAGGLLPNAYSGGAFFTPTHVARFIVEALRGLYGGFAQGSRFLEPSCGSGVFLEHCPDDAEVTALELDETSARVSSLLYPSAHVIQGDAFLHDRRDYYDFVIGNPPYGVALDVDAAKLPDEFTTLKVTKGRAKGKSELAFVELAIKAARPGGYIAFVLPMGIGQNTAAGKLRSYMRDTCWHVATVNLPPETFAHVGTSISTQILIMRKITPNVSRVHATAAQLRPYNLNDKRIIEYNAEFYEGQLPVYMAEITDIGYNRDGKSTDKWGDGLTQLDELASDFAGSLVRENLYPHIPSWISREDIGLYITWDKGCEGYRDAKLTYRDGPFRWNEYTLGIGEEINGYSTFDFSWQDEMVAAYTASKDTEEEAIAA